MSKIKACIKSDVQMTDGGTIAGYASTFDREPDSYGDIIAPGAFTKTLERWSALNADGKYIPLLWGHDTFDPTSNIGKVTKAVEDERGLYIEAEFDADNPKAQYVRKLAQEGRVYQFSFAYEVRDYKHVELEDGTVANELRDLELFEVSVVQIPANQHATVEEVKHAAELIKAGRRNSAKDADELREIARHAQEILDAVGELLSDTGQDTEEDGEDESKGCDSVEFVEAYRNAVKTMIGD